MNELSELAMFIPVLLLGTGIWLLIIEVARRVHDDE